MHRLLFSLFIIYIVMTNFSPVYASSNGQTCTQNASGLYYDSQCTAGSCTHGSGPAKFAGCFSNYAGQTASTPYCRTLCGDSCFGRTCCGDSVCNTNEDCRKNGGGTHCERDCGPRPTSCDDDSGGGGGGGGVVIRTSPTATPTNTRTPTPRPTTDPTTPTPTPTNPPDTPTPTPAFYSIRGTIFVDSNQDYKKNDKEHVYNPITISASGGTVSYPAPGQYLITDLPAGTYTVSYLSIPDEYTSYYPLGSPPSFRVTVGPGCTVDPTTGATCVVE